MAELEKVIKAWECCNPLNRRCFECPYDADCFHDNFDRVAIADMVKLLKEQKELLEKKQHDIDQMCVENSRLKHLLNNHLDWKPNCEAAEKSPAGCLGYGKSSTDDEPCEVCKNCPKQQSYGVE